MTIVSAASDPVGTEGILKDYLGDRWSSDQLPKYLSKEGRYVLSIEDGKVQGIAGFRKDSKGNCQIDCVYVREGSPEDTTGKMVRSLMSMAQMEGYSHVDVHAQDSKGDNIMTFYRMGFEDSGPCTCCQRDDIIHMRFRM